MLLLHVATKSLRSTQNTPSPLSQILKVFSLGDSNSAQTQNSDREAMIVYLAYSSPKHMAGG